MLDFFPCLENKSSLEKNQAQENLRKKVAYISLSATAERLHRQAAANNSNIIQ
ncbi:MAG: hypothetical protein U0L68_02910 [Prevotellamassilia sp.]|nr:hypothetical protein [Prevotellamassilia sp.]